MIVFDVPVVELGWTVVEVFMATQGQSLLLIYLLVWPLLFSPNKPTMDGYHGYFENLPTGLNNIMFQFAQLADVALSG